MNSRRHSRHSYPSPEYNDHARFTVTSILGDSKEAQFLDRNHLIIDHKIDAFTTKDDIHGWIARYRVARPWESHHGPIPIMIIIDGFFPELKNILRKSFPGFPSYLGDLVQKNLVRSPYRPAAPGDNGPLFRPDRLKPPHKKELKLKEPLRKCKHADVGFSMVHIGGSGTSRFEEEPPGPIAIVETSVGAWIGSVKDLTEPYQERPLLIVMFHNSMTPPGSQEGRPKSYSQVMLNHYEYHNPDTKEIDLKLFRRLGYNPLYLYFDIGALFTDYYRPVQVSQDKVQRWTGDSFDRKRRDVMSRVADVQRNLFYLSYLKETFNVHQICAERLRAIFDSFDSSCDCHQCHEKETIYEKQFKWRIDDNDDRIRLALSSIDMLVDQSRSLIDLEFNICSTKTDIRMEFLSVLLYTLAPVSFVASIFGITTFEASIGWFGLAGSIVFILALGVCVWIYSYLKTLEVVSIPRHLHRQDLINFANGRTKTKHGS